MLHWTAMSPGGYRRLVLAVMAFVPAIVACASVAGVWQTGSAFAASASPAALSVTVDHSLSLLSESVTVSVSGELSRSLAGAKLVVYVEGPADLTEVGHSDATLHEAAKLVQTLGQASGSQTTQTAPEQPGSSSGGATATGGPTTTGVDQADLQAGKLSATLVVPGGTPAAAGAYLLVVEVKSDDEVWARGQAWMGKAAPRDKPLDVAFVWPVALGIHRDNAGVYYDDVLQRAVAGDGQGDNSLQGLVTAAQRFSGWNLTLAIEPVLLTQLRDMADGYAFVDSSGKQVAVAANDPRAKNADSVLAALKDLAARGSVETAVSPYSGADLGILATAGWRDGFEQMQMGKQELQQTLALGGPLVAGYSPDLGLALNSLACYAEASIDHVVVSDAVAKLLAEPVDPGTIAVRARDIQNDRLTLMFASSGVTSVMTPPWDAGLLFAAVAAQLAATPEDALLVTPGAQFSIPPRSYLESIGRTLAGLTWVHTQTLTQLLRAHSPGTRPILVNASPASSRGYIETSLLAGLQAAHASVADLATVADPTLTQVDTAHRLLYMAESRWWWRPQTSPLEATIGLHYAEQAQQLARGELSKIRFVGAGSGTVTGGKGAVTLTVENGADYPVAVTLRLGGTGVSLPGGNTIKLDLQAGQTVVTVEVVSAAGPHKLDARLMAGTTTLDELSQSLRFLTLKTALPAVVVGGLAILAGLYFLGRYLLRSGRIPLLRRGPKSPGKQPAASSLPSPSAAAPESPAESPAESPPPAPPPVSA